MQSFSKTRKWDPKWNLLAVLFLVSGISLAGLSVTTRASLIAPPAEGTESLPPGARIETVLSGMNKPIAMAFDPAGRLFYTEKTTGNVRLFANGALQTNPVITFSVNSSGEQGLLGITIDPNFNANHLIYVYYTCNCSPLVNRVVRFTENNGVGTNPQTIFESPNGTDATNHNGGNIHFDDNGKLYISLGDDGATPSNAQNLTVKQGKMHRINPDGTIPTDNPVFTQAGALGSIYAIGLRNSFDFAFDPLVRGRIFASENGPGCDDEMNRIEAGFNYGWRNASICEGGNPDSRFNNIAPLWYLGNGACCEAPTGITVYTGNQIPQWRNHLFMAAYTGGKLRHFYLNDDRTAATAINVVQGVTTNMDIETGPDGALWYIEGGGYSDGTLKRIAGQIPSTQTPVAGPTQTAGFPPAVPGTNSRLFPETGKTVRGLFLDYWEKNGGLAQQGYPISDVTSEKSDLNGQTYIMQYFERAVFEYHPENQPPYVVLLSQLGTIRYKQKYPNGPPSEAPNNSPGSVQFPQTGKRLGGRFLDYWQKNGGVAQQGYPISEEFTETSDLNGRGYRVQYFERAVFEYHPENQPPYDVLLSQLGTFRLREKAAGKITAVTQLSSAPRAIAAGEGFLWAAREDGTVSRIDMTTNKVVGEAIPLGFIAPHDLTTSPGAVWVTGETKEEGMGGELRLARIDVKSGKVVANMKLPFKSNYNTVVADEAAAWVTDPAEEVSTISRIDPRTNQFTGQPLKVGAEPLALALGAGSLWSGSHDDGTVDRIDPSTGKLLARIEMGFDVHNITFGDGLLWVANYHQQGVSIIDPQTNKVRPPSIKLDFVPEPIAAGGGNAWVAATQFGGQGRQNDSRVARIDSRSGKIMGILNAGGTILDVAEANGAAWVAMSKPNAIVRIEP